MTRARTTITAEMQERLLKTAQERGHLTLLEDMLYQQVAWLLYSHEKLHRSLMWSYICHGVTFVIIIILLLRP